MKKLILLWFIAGSLPCRAIPPLINYQGYLTSPDGTPLDTVVAITFALYDNSSSGTILWTETQPSCTVHAGLFTTQLGSVSAILDSFHLAEVWLGIAVGSDAEMTPRNRIVAAAYAYRVGTVDGASGGIISGDIQVTGKATIGPGLVNDGEGSFVAGVNDTLTASANHSVVFGYANVVAGGISSVGGGSDNKNYGLYSTISGGRRNRIGAADSVGWTAWATVGGGSYNTATGNFNPTVAGGRHNTATGYECSTVAGGRDNNATASYATVGGGYDNTASNEAATVSGGHENTAQGMYSVVAGGGADPYWSFSGNSAAGDYSAVGGGCGNTAQGRNSVVAGGGPSDPLAEWPYYVDSGPNSATGNNSVVGGGSGNTAAGFCSTVPGGLCNSATGDYSFAGGQFARAIHNHAFVWAGSEPSLCSEGTPTNSFDNNTFTVRCANGARFYTDYFGTSAGVYLSAGGGAWGSLCDVRQKRLHGEVNTTEVLQKVSTLPLHRWSYKTQDESIQHIGPTAQDFYAAFSLGESDTTINTLDPDGVALAAIQELAKQNDDLAKRIKHLESMLLQFGLNETKKSK